MSIPNGTRLGPYEIVGAVGTGGMGVVYRGNDIRLGRPVAIKTLPPSWASDETRRRLFEQEVRALSAINHPNIVTLYGLGDPPHANCIVMELVEGRTLRQEISGARIRLRAVLEIGTQVASALSAAHSAGIVHRDIKPENVMVRPDGLVKVLDFGLAKLTRPWEAFQSPQSNPDIYTQDTLIIDGAPPSTPDQPLPAPRHTAGEGDLPWRVLGTTTYMSPENLRGQDVDARTDIFSLGVTLYELIAGVAPFGGRTPAEIIDAVLTHEPLPLSWYRPEVPRDLERIVSKAMRKDRDSRYQDTKDLLIDLQDVKHAREVESTLRKSAQYEIFELPRATKEGPQGASEASRSAADSSEQTGNSQEPASSTVVSNGKHKRTSPRSSVLPVEVGLVILVECKLVLGGAGAEEPE